MRSLYTFSLLLLLSVTAMAQTTIFDFEGTAPEILDFNGSVTNFIPNPDVTAPNTSATVAENTIPTAQEFAGIKLTRDVDLSTGKTFTMQVWSPVENAPLLLKFENADNTASTERTATASGPANSWQEVTFDFSSEADAVYPFVVIFMNFNVNTNAAPLTFYWDNLIQSGDGGGGGGDVTTLPLDFEDGAPTFNDFNGSFTSVILNPDMQAPNVSDSVAQNVVPADAAFAGVNIPLPINLGEGKTFTMQVWSPIADAPVLLKIENSQDDAVERAVNFSGAANSWQTLEFDFSSEADRAFAGVTIFMNFNVVGGEELTFYWDNLIQSGDGGGGDVTTLPLDFEDGAPTFNDFNGSFTSVITNPDMQVPNVSDSVARNIIPAGVEFAGVNIPVAVNLADGKIFTMQVWSPVADAPVLLKIENSQDDAVERAVNATGPAMSWQTLEYDFSSEADRSFAGVTIFMNFSVVGGEELTFYWDNLEQMEGDVGGGDLDQYELPITFEDEDVDYGLAFFGGATGELTADPDDANNTVGRLNKGPGGEVWAGVAHTSVTGGPSGLVTPIPFASDATEMTVRVWSPTAGTPIRLKAENFNDAANLFVETEVQTTVAAGWETLTFDFANNVDGTPALDLNTVYNQVVIFFNFGTAPVAEEIYYWDDIMFVGDPNGTNTPVLGLLEVFPNPAQDRMTITAPARMEDITLYDFNGRVVSRQTVNAERFELDMTALTPGMYVALVNTADGAMTVKVIKE